VNGSALFEAVYSRLILRDIFGKIVPGCLILAAFFVGSRGTAGLLSAANSLSLGVFIVVLGVAWVAGFAVQGLGETLGGFLYDPPEVHLTSVQRNDLRLEIRRKADDGHDLNRQNIERLIVIREACGNSYVALAVLGGVWLWRYGFDSAVSGVSVAIVKSEVLPRFPLFLLFMSVLMLLRKMHFTHVARSYVHAVRLFKQLAIAHFANFQEPDDASICDPGLASFAAWLLLAYSEVALFSVGFGLAAK
jgi:hypothetical protein